MCERLLHGILTVESLQQLLVIFHGRWICEHHNICPIRPRLVVHVSSDVSVTECQARYSILKEEPLVIEGTESSLLRLVSVEFVKLRPDATIDNIVLRGTLQLCQVVTVLEQALCWALDPLASHLATHCWIGGRILQHFERIHLRTQAHKLYDWITCCLVLELPDHLQEDNEKTSISKCKYQIE